MADFSVARSTFFWDEEHRQLHWFHTSRHRICRQDPGEKPPDCLEANLESSPEDIGAQSMP